MPIDDLQVLQREAESLRRRFARGLEPDARHSGSDSTGTVHVIVGGDGRVTAVILDRSWREAVGPQGLGAAVLESVGDASAHRLSAWAEVVADEVEPPVEPGPAPTQAPTSSSVHADSSASRQGVRDLLAMLENVEAELDDLDRRIDQRASQQVVGRSPSHLVTVRMGGGGEVTDVDVQRRLIDRSDDRGIVRELRSAFDAAYERAGSMSLEAQLGSGSLAKIHALGADPGALLGRLGLDPREQGSTP